MNNHEVIDRQFLALAQRFKEKLPVKLRKIETGMLRYFNTNPGTTFEANDSLDMIYHDIHKLTGTGSTFGLDMLTLYARKIEDIVSSLLDGKINPSEGIKKEIFRLLGIIKQEYQINDSIVSGEQAQVFK